MDNAMPEENSLPGMENDDFMDFDDDKESATDSFSESASLTDCLSDAVSVKRSTAGERVDMDCACADVAGPSSGACRVCADATAEDSIDIVDEIVKNNEDEGLGLFTEDIRSAAVPICVVDCEACAQTANAFVDADGAIDQEQANKPPSLEGTSAPPKPQDEQAAFQHDWNWTSNSLRSYEMHPMNRLFGSSSNKSFVNVTGPYGPKLIKEIYLPQWKVQMAMTQPSSAVSANFSGDDFHTSLLKDSVPTFDYLLWSLSEAEAKQVTQMSPSSCAATAVANVLRAFGFVTEKEAIKGVVPTIIPAQCPPLAEYLLSRSVAGASHSDLIAAVDALTNGKVQGRFFHMFPRRKVYLVAWLLFWLKNGAVPVLTLNYQHGVLPGHPVPDSWHHQMAFGGGARGIYLTNPLEIVPESFLEEYLCSDSVLLVKTTDIFRHWELGSNLKSLALKDPQWINHNIVGQVLCVTRQRGEGGHGAASGASHVTIPATCKSGVTLFARSDTRTWDLIKSAPELPLTA